ncbi:cupin domain-containing protein [Sulfitobacter pacificus]|uniref:Cupin n=1 Tax=Sulfitobacter pacificus TaxID=1499314 RepID=A0ABQ5VQ67_9RHOB|nr:cupin domain-containing protein [Sulfitobacter pacificus]GLQ29285.1 cupin [Sulfitobacter pacificus]
MTNRKQAIATELVRDDRVVVTRYDFEQNSETGWHRHEMDYVVVALTECQMLIEDQAGSSTVNVARGEAYSRQAGIAHNVVNAGDQAMSFVKTELVPAK